MGSLFTKWYQWMNLVYVQTFLAVAEAGSFTAAADHLDVSKGLVSRHVQRLEATLNTRLFHRSTRAVTLTESGEALHAKAKQLQLLATETEMQIRDMSQALSGDLRITAPIELGRALCRQVIPEFNRLYPEVTLILDFGPLKKQIESGDFDLALRAYDELPEDVIAKELGHIRNVLVCSRDYAEGVATLGIDDIHSCSFILNSQNERWNRLALINGKREYQVEVTGELRANTYSAILELAQQGLGVASLPYYQVEEKLDCGELVQIFEDWSIRAHKLSLIYAQRRVTPKKLTTFNQAVLAWLRSDKRYLIQ